MSEPIITRVAGPFEIDFWFHIAGDEAWTVVDSAHDYRNRVLGVAGFWNAGTPAEGGSWNENDVAVANPSGSAWGAKSDAQGLTTFVTNNSAIDIEILRFLGTVASAVGDFTLRVDGATGNLEAQSTNFTVTSVQYQVRVRIDAGNQLAATDDYNIT